jgi:two-component system NtrC family response regulator
MTEGRMEKLLIIEDDEDILTQLKWGLSKYYKVLVAKDRDSAMKVIRKERPKVVTLDLGLPPEPDNTENGFRCLGDILQELPSTKVIVITGNNEKESALKSVEMGAYDFYQKPINISELKVILKRAFYLYDLEQENIKMYDAIKIGDRFEGMIGFCPKMQEIFRTIKRIATTDATVLIIGESGTGKELVARAIHGRSHRKNGPFIPINCGGIPDTLIESELFGYEKWSFTDAKISREGMIEKSNAGTLFLDEIGELPPQIQVKILRFLQGRKIQRIGGRDEIDIDTRIISATNKDLHSLMKEGKFREDLYYRISVITIELPPLRERGDDILLLANSFLRRFNYLQKRNIKGFSESAIEAIKSYDWPGNVRELENKVQRAVIMSEGKLIKPHELLLETPEMEVTVNEGYSQLNLKDIRKKIELDTVMKALLKNSWNISKTAEELNISRPTLYSIIKKFIISPSS